MSKYPVTGDNIRRIKRWYLGDETLLDNSDLWSTLSDRIKANLTMTAIAQAVRAIARKHEQAEAIRCSAKEDKIRGE